MNREGVRRLVSTTLQFSIQCLAERAKKVEIGFCLEWRFRGGKGLFGAVERI